MFNVILAKKLTKKGQGIRFAAYVYIYIYIFTFIEKAFNFPPVTVGPLPYGNEHSEVILIAAKHESSSVIPQPADYETNITAQICEKKPANVLLSFLCGVLNFHLNILKWGCSVKPVPAFL